MTGKRFIVYNDDDADIWEDGYFLAVAYNHANAKKIAKKLNKLANGNKQLKEQNRQLRLENGKLTHDLFWANKKIEEELR